MALSAATVSIVRAEDLKERIVQAVKLIGGMGNVVRKGDKVLVKPNLVDGASAETGETADPRAIRTVVELCFAAGANDVLVGEGEVYTGRRARLYDRIRELIEPLGAKVVNKNIAALLKLVTPQLGIIDGFVGMQGDGPVGGEPLEWNIAIAGDPLECDVYCVHRMGFDPVNVGYLRRVGAPSVEKIKLVGDEIPMKNFKPHRKFELQLMWEVLSP